MRALVIDDDKLSRMVMRETLEAAGHDVLDLPSPIGATSVMLRERVDVVVIDVMMPSMSGDKLARLVRGHPQLQQMAIILVSSSDDERMHSLAMTAGAYFISKNHIRESLSGLVAWIGKQPSQAPATERLPVRAGFPSQSTAKVAARRT